MFRKSLDLILVIALALAAGAVALSGANNAVLRAAAGLPLVLILPGYALAAALFPGPDLRLPERLLVVPALSIILTALGGFALNWTQWGLRVEAWACLLSGITLLAAAAALVRRGSLPASPPLRFSLGLSFNQVLMFWLALVVVAGAITVAYAGAIQQPHLPFTQLWLLPDEERGLEQVTIGIYNMEAVPINYHLQILVGESIAQEWPAILLSPGERWETDYQIPQRPGYKESVEARLYRMDAPGEIYRRAELRRGKP